MTVAPLVRRAPVAPPLCPASAAGSAAAVVLACVLAGCMPTAMIAWSPDGRRAVYGVVRTDANPVQVGWSVVDAAGGPAVPVAADLGPFVPWFAAFTPLAWSADSRSLWLVRHDDPAGAAVLWRWADGDARPVAFLLVPPGSLTGKADATDRPQAAGGTLVAYHVPTATLYHLSDVAGFGLCFSGPGRLAFLQADRDAGYHPTSTGHLVEVTLAAGPTGPPDPTPVVDALLTSTVAVEPAADGLSFLAAPRSFPATPPVDPTSTSAPSPTTLYHWTRSSGQLAPVATDVCYFTPSPDGTRVLTLSLAGQHTRLAVQNADGTGRRPLRDLGNALFAIAPAWHGNDRVTFQSRVGVEKRLPNGEQATFDVVDYELTAAGLTGGRSLTGNWPDGMKPVTLTPRPATAATSGPATLPSP